MIRKFSMIALLTLTGWVTTSNAALIGTCTFASGCGPDFNVSTGLAVDYTYNAGSETGVFSITSTVSDASFLEGQLDSAFVNAINNVGDPYGRTSLTVVSATGGNGNFSLSFDVDKNGNLLGTSNISMNGRVVAFDSNVAGFLVTADSFNGTALNGNLIAGGSINQIGWNNNTLDFRGLINGSSLLTTAGFGTDVAGVLSMSNTISGSSSGNIEWDESWTANGTLDVVVPVPAAAWLFASGLITIFSVSRRKNSIN